MRFSRLFASALVLGWISLLPSTFLASPPANDLCQSAIVVPANGPFPYLTPIITNIDEATASGDPAPPPACGVTADAFTSGGIWYAFTPATSGLYYLSVSDDTETTVEDTFMAVYRSATGCAGPLVPVGCNDDTNSLKSALGINLTASSNYFVAVWAAYSPPSPDMAAVQLRVSFPTVPTNDVFAEAEGIPGAGPFPYLTQITDTALATTNGDPAQPTCSTNTFAQSVWYRFTPSASRTYVVSTCDDTRTTVYDTMLAIYTGSCGSLIQVACSDIFDRRAVVTNAFTAGTTYFILVGDASNEGVTPGQTLMQLRIFEPRAPEANVASSLTGTSAVLNATVPNFNTAHLRAWFEWGLNVGYGNVTPAQSLTTGTNDLHIGALVSSLASGETYHYRLVVSNGCFGVMRSADQSFKWSSTRPTLLWSSAAHKLQFTGNPGQQYTVFTANAPTNFQPTATATDLGNGNFEYVDPNWSTTRSRFFLIHSP